MIAINPILAAASQAGKGKPIFYITLYSYYSAAWHSLGSFDCLSAELTRLKVSVTVQDDLVGTPYIVTTCGVPYAITVTRGLTVAGTDYTITTRKYFVSSAAYLANDGYSQIFADLLPNVAVMNIAADTLAGTVINNALTYGLVTDYAQDLTRDIWYGWKFDATGEVLNLYDARSISSLLASKYLAYLFPRAGGLYAWNIASNFENPEDGNYTPFSHARIKSIVTADKYLNLAWVSETGKQYMTRAPEYPYHALGFISNADAPLTYAEFTEWGQVFDRQTYEIEQRPDFSLEQGDLVKLSLDSFGLIRCLELTEVFKKGRDPKWVQIIRQLPYHPTTGTTAGPKTIADYPDNPAPKPTASNILLRTGRFTRLLSKADSNVQEAIDTIDNLEGYLDSIYLKLSGGTMTGDIVMPNNGVIGQAGEPRIVFQITNNVLEIAGANLTNEGTFHSDGDIDTNGKFIGSAAGLTGVPLTAPVFALTEQVSPSGISEITLNFVATGVGTMKFAFARILVRVGFYAEVSFSNLATIYLVEIAQIDDGSAGEYSFNVTFLTGYNGTNGGWTDPGVANFHFTSSSGTTFVFHIHNPGSGYVDVSASLVQAINIASMSITHT
jgi:hypothetical protein